MSKYNLKIFANNVEAKALEQIHNYTKLIGANQKIRIMPDTHAGAGCVIGFTADLNMERIVPNIIGVDISCGVITYPLGLRPEEIDLQALDKYIHENVSLGFGKISGTIPDIPEELKEKIKEISIKIGHKNKYQFFIQSLPSLGGGNHFIELDSDGEETYLTVHTGSRNFGFRIAIYYQRKGLPLEGIPKELRYLSPEDAEEYLKDSKVAQEYAKTNRRLILKTILRFFGQEYDESKAIESVHNYIDMEDKIIRKGAIRAHKGETVVIPMNMAFGVVIGEGKGNEDWNYSAPHGAGRVMSRRQARSELSLKEFKESMSRVYSSTVDETTLDEAPMVYKNPFEIIEFLKETVQNIKVYKSIFNIKGGD